jgi:chromosome segregation ATPase
MTVKPNMTLCSLRKHKVMSSRSPARASPNARAASRIAGTEGDVSALRADVTKLSDLNRQAKDMSKSYASQAAALKRDLALVQRQIDFERERRKEIQRMVDVERTEAIPSEHSEAVARREEDVRTVKEEMAAMMEWLKRGIAEAQTISLDCESLREKASTSHVTQAELQAEKQRLEQMERRLTVEVADAAGKIKRLQDASIGLEEHTDHQKSLLSVTRDITFSAVADRDRLRADVDELQKRAREVETIEIAVSCMAASVRRSLHTLEVLQNAVAHGTLATEMDADDDNDGYDSDNDADPTRVTPVVLTSTKAKIGRCEALLLTLYSSLRRFDHDEQLRQTRFRAEYNEEQRAALDHLNAFKKHCAGEVAHLMSIVNIREPQLRMAIDLRNRANNSETGVAVFGDAPSFTLTEYYEVENHKLADEVDRLRLENESIRAHAATLEGDYNAVRELRREYRELEARKMSLSQGLRKEEDDNRLLKLDLNEVKGDRAASPSSNKRPPWRAVATY